MTRLAIVREVAAEVAVDEHDRLTRDEGRRLVLGPNGSEGTWSSLISRHMVPHIRIGPRLVVFSRKTLLAFLAERVVEAGR